MRNVKENIFYENRIQQESYRKTEGAKTRNQVVINSLVKIHASENICTRISANFSRKNSSLKQVS